jgi:CO/xanthine dehydrogenase Mo-binding subunit
MPGVVAVYTAHDLPGGERVASSRQTTLLAREVVRYRGEPVAVVVATSEEAAADGAAAVMVEYTALKVVADLDAALADNAELIWPDGPPSDDAADLTAAHAAVDHGAAVEERAPSNVHERNTKRRGDVERALREADVVIERHYRTNIVHQGYMEPHASTVDPDPFKRTLTVYTSTQGQFGVRDEVARLLGLPKSAVNVVPMTVGGGFGAKYGIIDPLAAATALKIGRPVRLVLTRSEDFLTTTPSPATAIDLKLGAKNDGTIVALDAVVALDNGVYPFTLGGIVTTLLGGYYRCENVQIRCDEVLTHKPQTGAYRAPGAPQATFALETAIDELAQKLGRDPLELRLQNASQTGDLMGNNDPWPSIGIKPVLEAAQQHPLWRDRKPGDGVGLAIGGWPCGITAAAAVCRADTDGTIRVHVGSVDISGVNTTFALVAAEILDVPPEQVEIVQGDTRSGPFAGPSGGSQITYSVSGAVAEAARTVKRQLLEMAVDVFEARMEDLEMKDGKVFVKGLPDRAVSIGELAEKAQNQRGGPGPIVGEGRSALSQNAPGFVAHIAQVAVDKDTGRITPLQYVAIQDVGFAMNPMLVEGQIHGGSAQGIGWGLYEALRYDENGELSTGTLMDYALPRASELPPIEVVLVENRSPQGPFGARGVGEPPITAGAAALANAVADACGARLSEIPMRDETLWRALNG